MPHCVCPPRQNVRRGPAAARGRGRVHHHSVRGGPAPEGSTKGWPAHHAVWAARVPVRAGAAARLCGGPGGYHTTHTGTAAARAKAPSLFVLPARSMEWMGASFAEHD